MLLTLAPLVLLAPAAGQEVTFNRDVRPILSARCFRCHGPDASTREAGLRLDWRDEALEALSPGAPEESELLRRVSSHDPGERMPPPVARMPALSAAEQATLREWIASGAQYQAHWAYQPIVRPTVPELPGRDGARSPIDRFVLAALDGRGLEPGPRAEARTLERRLTFDLVGLPPTPELIGELDLRESPGDLGLLADRLLESPRHAERMAVHWLDLVRFADTVGYHGDQDHNIAPYRDWVLAAFRDNLPFDVFTRDQLAGDLLEEPTSEQLIATGYNRLLQTSHECGVQDAEHLAKYAADRVRNLGAVWLGTTTGCCECHDHKYDPVTQREFYQLAAFFADVTETGNFKGSKNSCPTARPPELDVITSLERERAARMGVEPTARRTMVTQAQEPRVVRLLPRGNWLDSSGPIVQPDVPSILPPLGVEGRRATRLDLANWLTSGEHPLTARVVANRIWQVLFGRGLARELDDLGSQGEPPTHPELLDWLACELMDSGWDLRHLIRLIVASETYARSSVPGPGQLEADPDNRWLARQGRFRVQAEFVRDAALAVSGLLVNELGGASVKPYQPAGYYAHLNFPRRRYARGSGPELYRRSVYMHWQRQFVHPVLRAFDAPSREECTALRPTSSSPGQALALLNSPAFVEAARALADRYAGEASSTGEAAGDTEQRSLLDRALLSDCFAATLRRAPDQQELELLAGLLEQHRRRFRQDPESAAALLAVGEYQAASTNPAELAAWTSAARVILNLDELYRRN